MERVMVAGGNGQLYCLGLLDGHVVGSIGCGATIRANPCHDPWRGHVWVVGDEPAQLVVISEGSVWKRMPLPSSSSCRPAFSLRYCQVYVALLSGHVHAYLYNDMAHSGGAQSDDDRSTLRPFWTHWAPSPIFSTPAVLPSGEIIVGHVDGRVYGVDWEGAQHWSVQLEGYLFADITHPGGSPTVIHLPGAIMELTSSRTSRPQRGLASGPQRSDRSQQLPEGGGTTAEGPRVPGVPHQVPGWQEVPTQLLAPGGVSTWVTQSMVLTVTHDSYLYCLEGVDGTVLWKLSLRCGPLSTPPCLAVQVISLLHHAAEVCQADNAHLEKVGLEPATSGCTSFICLCTNEGGLLVVSLPGGDQGVTAAGEGEQRGPQGTGQHRGVGAPSKLSKEVPRGVKDAWAPALPESLGDVALASPQPQVVARYRLSAGIFSAPVSTEGHLVFGCRDDRLYCVKVVGSK